MTTRRNILKSVPAVLIATALPGNAVAAPGAAQEDRELRRLWSDYLDAATAYMAARDAHDPARDAYDAEVAPDGITPALVISGGYCKGPLWEESVEPLWRAVNAAGEHVRAAIDAIRSRPAEGLTGVAIMVLAQLSRLHSDPDETRGLRSRPRSASNRARLALEGRTKGRRPSAPSVRPRRSSRRILSGGDSL